MQSDVSRRQGDGSSSRTPTMGLDERKSRSHAGSESCTRLNLGRRGRRGRAATVLCTECTLHAAQWWRRPPPWRLPASQPATTGDQQCPRDLPTGQHAYSRAVAFWVATRTPSMSSPAEPVTWGTKLTSSRLWSRRSPVSPSVEGPRCFLARENPLAP